MSGPNLEQAEQHIKQLNASLEAAKQMVNEQLTMNLSLKTNINLFQQAHQEAVAKTVELQKEIVALKAKVSELTPQFADQSQENNA